METKWYKTKKFWVAVVAVAVFGLGLFGVELDEATQASILNGITGLFN